MKLRKILILLFFMFTLGVVGVDAATYNMILETQSLSVDENSNVDIFITLDNINGTTNGLNGCLADLKTDSNIVINSIENMNGWEVTQGNRLLLDGSNVFNRTQIAKINATVKGETILSLTNITSPILYLGIILPVSTLKILKPKKAVSFFDTLCVTITIDIKIIANITSFSNIFHAVLMIFIFILTSLLLFVTYIFQFFL